MTEYWVSQGNKWCDSCKIYIANNPASIRNHELGQRHKDSVAKRLASMRQEKAAKDKEQKEATCALEQIEAVVAGLIFTYPNYELFTNEIKGAKAPLRVRYVEGEQKKAKRSLGKDRPVFAPNADKAKRSYQKDISAFQEARDSNANALVAQEDGQGSAISGEEWEYDSSSGYYCNQSNGCYYDPNSGFYYTDALGRWVTREEAFAASQASSHSAQKKLPLKKPLSASEGRSVSENKGAAKSQNGAPPGPIVSASLNPMRSVKGAPSSLTVNKRKRQDEKRKAVSEEEAAARKAREAARKRLEDREKPLLGLYRH